MLQPTVGYYYTYVLGNQDEVNKPIHYQPSILNRAIISVIQHANVNLIPLQKSINPYK
jgi:hypothetical protein